MDGESESSLSPEELWGQLNYEKKESNCAQAKCKNYMGELIELFPPLPERDAVLSCGKDLKDILAMLKENPVIDVLAAQEHCRWCMFHYASGYVGYHPDQAQKGKYHRLENQYYGKVHNCLIDDWDEMKRNETAGKTILYDVCGIYSYQLLSGKEAGNREMKSG